jgi:hypothetical protein
MSPARTKGPPHVFLLLGPASPPRQHDSALPAFSQHQQLQNKANKFVRIKLKKVARGRGGWETKSPAGAALGFCESRDRASPGACRGRE